MAEKSCSSTGCTKESCAGCPSAKVRRSRRACWHRQIRKSHIHKVIGVVSGKGGVGKSLVTASLANLMKEQGYSVGILDADITGPSIPKMYGLHGPAEMDGDYIKPVVTENGIPVMSINLLLPDEGISGHLERTDPGKYGKTVLDRYCVGEIDYLFVDMPPGTGDVPLTVFQSIPVDGIITVTSPQDLVSLIVKKALNMAKSMDIPVIGLVENYSYVICPDCGKEFKIFGESGLDKLAEELDLPILGRMPIDPKLAELASGEFAKANNEYLAAAESLLIALEG